MRLPVLDIVIVNWNAGVALRDALQSIADSSRTGYQFGRVVVVDNASRDRSADGLVFSNLPLRVIRNAENRGFAAACNQGDKESQADYVLFLNPDTRVFPETLAKTLEWMRRPDAVRVGIAGVQLVDDRGQVARTCARFPRPAMFLTKMFGMGAALRHYVPEHFYLEWDHRETRMVDQVMGAYFLVRNDVFRQLGGFDERFFVYFEEVDFSIRAKRAGWETWFISDIQCYHRGCGTTDQIKAKRLYYSLQSRILYGFKHWGRSKAVGMMLATLLIEPFSRAAQALVRGSGSGVAEVMQGFWLLWKAVPRILRTAMASEQKTDQVPENKKEVPDLPKQEASLTGAQPGPGGVVRTTHPGSLV